jgi:hypothetical protein
MQGTTELREKLATACRLLFMEGLMDHAGLAGARIPETGNLLLNPREMRGTPGRHPGIMTAGDFVQYRASAIGTPKAMKGDALRRAQKQVWQPKVISKMWHYYVMKGQSKGILG